MERKFLGRRVEWCNHSEAYLESSQTSDMEKAFCENS